MAPPPKAAKKPADDPKKAGKSKEPNKTDADGGASSKGDGKKGTPSTLGKSELDLPAGEQGGAPMGDVHLTCALHRKPLPLYCTSCEEPVCESCVSTGPHNTQLHRVVDVAAAYRSAVSELSYALSSGLLNRRDMLFAQLHRLAHRMDEITYVRGVIEKDIKGEFGGILDRLRGAEGKKVAVLQNQMAGLQADVEKIDHLFHEYDQVKGDKIEFLLRSRSLREDVEGLLLKVFKTEIDQTPYDLPRELKDLRAKLERKAVGTQLLKLKDEVIWKLFTEKKDREEKAIENYNTQVSAENASWQNFIDKHTQELKRYELVCFFCADVLGGSTVNKKCKVNENKSISPNFQGFTITSPERDFIGNGKHFFARPKPDLFGSNQAFDNLQQLFTDQQTEVIKKKTMWEIGANLLLVKKAARERNINVEALLKAHDKSDLGMMSKPKFTYLLHEKLGIGQDKVNCFMMLLDPQHKGMVNYREFLTMMNKPELLDNEVPIGDQMVNKGILGMVADAAEGISVDQSNADIQSRQGSRQGDRSGAPQVPIMRQVSTASGDKPGGGLPMMFKGN